MELCPIITPMEGLYLIEKKQSHDARGFFMRSFCQSSLGAVLQGRTIMQINQSKTARKGTVRGLHFQYPPHAEMKFVSCIKGSVWDVAVDLRKGSATFLQYFAVTLSSENSLMLCIPEGFAHGFQTLDVDCEMLYYHTADHHPDSEGVVNALDPMVAIDWPLPIESRSTSDTEQPMLLKDFCGVKAP